MDHEQASELLGAYALDALSVEEREAVDAHLATCAACTAELVELSAVHDLLGLLAPEREPSPALRTRLMTIVEEERDLWLREQRAIPQRAVPLARPSWWERLVTATRGLPRIAYGAGVAVALAAVLLVVLLSQRSTVTIHSYACAVLASPPGVDLRSARCSIGVRSDHQTDVAFNNLPALPVGKSYELWFIPDPKTKKAPVPIQGFTAAVGSASYKARLIKDASGYALAAVTIEPSPGNSPAPTTSPVLLVKLQS